VLAQDALAIQLASNLAASANSSGSSLAKICAAPIFDAVSSRLRVNPSRSRVPRVASTARRSAGTFTNAASICSMRCRVTASASRGGPARGTGMSTTKAHSASASACAAVCVLVIKSRGAPSSVPAWLASWTSPCSEASRSSNEGSSTTASFIDEASSFTTVWRPAPMSARIATLAPGASSSASIALTRSFRPEPRSSARQVAVRWTASTTAAGVMPSFSSTTSPGAEAP
jgi:hypothetical protein